MSLSQEKRYLTDEGFGLFQKLILEKTGLYFQAGRRHQVENGLSERILKRQLSSYKAYFNFLKNDPKSSEEIQNLVDILTIQETSFFRNQPQFEVFKSYIIPAFLRKRREGNSSIRIWSAGCSTGQEIYSIAILLRELLPDISTWHISLLATDISQPALASAKRGIYHRKYLENIPEQYRKKYFYPHGENEVEISYGIKKMVQIEQHNLATDSYNRKGMRELDVIFCKNVTIYFNESTTRNIVSGFYKCLSESGHLFIGHSETLWKISEKFRAIEFPDTFIYCKESSLSAQSSLSQKKKTILKKSQSIVHTARIPKKTLVKPEKIIEESGVGEKAPQNTNSEDTEFDRAMQAAKLKQFDQAISIFTQFKPESPHYNSARLAHATLMSNQGKYDDAIRLLNDILEENSLSEDAYYLLGVLKNRTGEYEEAARMFQKTLYVNPRHTLAAFSLGEVYRQTHQTALARKTYLNALKLLQNLPSDQILSFFEDVTPDLLTQACVKRLDLLEAGT